MHRHSTDLVGLLFGLAFAIAGTCFLVRETTDAAIDPAWATGLGLILLGTVALVATLAPRFWAPSRRAHSVRVTDNAPSQTTDDAVSIGSSSRVPVARSLRSTTPRARPFAPTTSCTGIPSRSASANFTPGLTSRSS